MTVLILVAIVCVIIQEMFHRRISLNLVLLLLLVIVSFFAWVQVGIDIYPHRKYQVKRHSSTWLSAACAAAIVIEVTFFIVPKG